VIAPPTLPKPRKFLSVDGLIQTLRNRFADVPDHRMASGTGYSMVDTLMTAFAMFSLKDHSLLAFQKLFGETQYVHQAVAAVIVNPDRKEVILLAIGPIVKRDGETNNDCERNASKRLLRRIRKLYPKLKLIADHAHFFEQATNAPCRRSAPNGVVPERSDWPQGELVKTAEFNHQTPSSQPKKPALYGFRGPLTKIRLALASSPSLTTHRSGSTGNCWLKITLDSFPTIQILA